MTHLQFNRTLFATSGSISRVSVDSSYDWWFWLVVDLVSLRHTSVDAFFFFVTTVHRQRCWSWPSTRWFHTMSKNSSCTYVNSFICIRWFIGTLKFCCLFFNGSIVRNIDVHTHQYVMAFFNISIYHWNWEVSDLESISSIGAIRRLYRALKKEQTTIYCKFVDLKILYNIAKDSSLLSLVS